MEVNRLSLGMYTGFCDYIQAFGVCKGTVRQAAFTGLGRSDLTEIPQYQPRRSTMFVLVMTALLTSFLSLVTGFMTGQYVERWRRLRSLDVSIAIRDWWLDDDGNRHRVERGSFGSGMFMIGARNSGTIGVSVSKVYWMTGFLRRRVLTTPSWEKDIYQWPSMKLPADLASGQECLFQIALMRFGYNHVHQLFPRDVRKLASELRWLKVCVELTDGTRFTMPVDRTIKEYIKACCTSSNIDEVHRRDWCVPMVA